MPWVLPVEHYTGQIYSEMSRGYSHKFLERYRKKHPPEMIEWIENSRTLDWSPDALAGVTDFFSNMFKKKVEGEPA